MKKFLSAFLALALIVSVVSVCGGRADAAKALPEGVLYYWGFENDSDLIAIEQMERRPGSVGAATYDLIPANRKPEIAEGLGVSGNALRLDGTYGVKLIDLEKIELDAYTISVWVYSTKAVDYAPAVVMGSNLGADPRLGGTTWVDFCFTPENKDNIMFSMVETYDSEKGSVEFPGINAFIGGDQDYGFIPGEWQMITLVVDGKKFIADDQEEHVGTKFYVNGKLTMEANAEHNGTCAAMPGLLAGDFIEGLVGIDYHNECFQGYMDELYIFDRALSDEAVGKVLAAGNPKPIPFMASAPKVPAPVVTKDPTSESVTEGGNAYFVARGENYNYIDWYIVSADHNHRMRVSSAPWNFPGLSYAGDGTTTLLLSNIPMALNGWCVEAVFTGDGGTATSRHCFINVAKAAKAPLYAVPSSGFYTNPKDVQLISAPGDAIAYELIDEYGYARTGTVMSGEYITIPIAYDMVYVARLTAHVVGDQSNLTICEYTMDGTIYETTPAPAPVPEPAPAPEPEPAPQPSFGGGGFTNNEATVTLTPTGNGNFYANVNILRLCDMDGSGNYSNGIVTMFLTDPSGSPMGAEFNVNSATLTITYSTWDLLPQGTAFYGVY